MQKSNDISFKKTKVELKNIFKVVDSLISDKHVESFFKYEYKLKKVQSQLINMINCVLQTFNTNKAVPHAIYIYIYID